MEKVKYTRNESLKSQIANAKLIIVHGGQQVHFDEFFACAIARWCGCQAPIVRRNPTEAELADPSVLVMDVGMQFEATLLNFDHHEDRDMPSAYYLLATCLGVTIELEKVFRWFKIWSDIDAHGPFKTAEDFQLHWEQVAQFLNPVDETVLRLWGQDTAWGERILQELATMLHGVLDLDEKGRTPCQAIEQDAKIYGINRKVIVDMRGINKYREWQAALIDDVEGSVKIFDDDREPFGIGLLRTQNDLDVDFNRIKGQPHVSFIHPGGFIAKLDTKDVSDEDINKLITMAIKA